jgi:hypothetical protein
LTLLIALMIVSPSLLKGQVVKKMGSDSVIVLTLKQGKAINNMIDSLEKQLGFKSDSVKILKSNLSEQVSVANLLRTEKLQLLTLKDTLEVKTRINLDTLNDYKNRYYKNIEIYNKYEKSMDFEIKLHRLNSVLFAILTFFMYSQIK